MQACEPDGNNYDIFDAVIISVHQPAYLPWLGYFDKICRSNVFVFLDTVQFETNSYVNRNKIKTLQGKCWLTIPVRSKGHMSNTIMDIGIDNTKNWRKKHQKTIFHSYSKSKFFHDLYPKLTNLYKQTDNNLADTIFAQTLFWLEELEISTKVVRSSQLEIGSKNSELIVNLCEHFNATKYISGALGRNYLDENEFRERSIEIEFQNYVHPCYPQLHGKFIPNLSIVDFLMNSRELELIVNK